MERGIITRKAKEFLKDKEFINVATCDFDGRPNVAPKLILKIEENYIYLVDYVIAKTYSNLKINPMVSLSTVDMISLTGYQINGKANIITKRQAYNELLEEFRQRQIRFCVTRIIQGVQKAEKHQQFETTFPERIAIFKVTVEDVVEIIPTGELKREKIRE